MKNDVAIQNRINRNLLFLSAGLAIITLVMSVLASLMSLFPGDLGISRFFQSADSAVLLSAMKFVSDIFAGWHSVVLVAGGSIIIFWLLGKRQAVLTVIAGVFCLLGTLLKGVVGRPRPSIDLVKVLEVNDNGSFPSGHALISFVFLGIIAYFVATRVPDRILRITIPVLLVLLTVLVGISRIYLGAHWASDVLGGYVLGGIILGLFIYCERVWK